MSQQGKYIYGIIEETQPKRLGIRGVGDTEVYAITDQGIGAILSDIELLEIDPTRKNVLAHTTVQDTLLKKHDLLPMGFGMIAHNEGEVQMLLRANRDALVRELKRLSGLVEVELKIYWDEKSMIEELQGKNQKYAKLKKRIEAAPNAVAAQNILMEASQEVERVASEWKNKFVQDIYAALKEFSVDAQTSAPVGVKNLLNASFLIQRTKEPKFKEELFKLDSKYKGRLNFKYVGPLPPYNFVKVKLGLSR